MKQRVKIERSLGSPADQRVSSVRAKRVPCAGAVPIVDEAGHARAIVTLGDGFAEALRDAGDLGPGGSASSAHLPQQVEGRRLIERQACDPVRADQRHVQRDAAAVRVTGEMDPLVRHVDQLDCARRFVGQREGVPAGPRSGAFAAVMFGREHLIAAAQRLAETAPLAGACARAVQGDHPRAVSTPRRFDMDVHGSAFRLGKHQRVRPSPRSPAAPCVTAWVISQRVSPMSRRSRSLIRSSWCIAANSIRRALWAAFQALNLACRSDVQDGVAAVCAAAGALEIVLTMISVKKSRRCAMSGRLPAPPAAAPS
jgi:hypothetical protein